MAYNNRARIILNDYGFWPIEKTFYEEERFSDSAATFRFGCHQQHTTITFKIDEIEFAKANTQD